ncbi:MAG: hypothetical protein V4543_14340 [Bacteroidota bacterium]
MQRGKNVLLFGLLLLFASLYSCKTKKQVSAIMPKTVNTPVKENIRSVADEDPRTGMKGNIKAAYKPAHESKLQTDAISDRYETAFKTLNDMLEGKAPLIFKQAVFTAEHACDSTLSFEDFDARVQKLTRYSKAWMQANRKLNYREKDSLNFLKNMAIFKVLKDTVYYLDRSMGPIPVKMIAHLPYNYDFDDFFGKADWSKMFVSKLLATGTGNCHSMPYLYKILADELGAKAWISTGPNHLYIRNRSKEHGWYNTELTSGVFPTDAWICASGYISLDAIRSGIFTDTLSQKQCIALCMYDLAKGYEAIRKNSTDGFMIKCANAVLKVQPNSVNALILKAECLRSECEQQMQAKGIKNITGLSLIPGLKTRYTEMERLYMEPLRLGYREMPARMYLNWLTSVDEKRDGNQKIARTLDTARFVHNPFASIGKSGRMLTLSKGRYDEGENNDSIQYIGGMALNMRKGQIIGLRQRDTGDSETVQNPTVISTFWSVDPMASEYPSWSPYAYCLNNPIRYIDPDGRDPDDYVFNEKGNFIRQDKTDMPDRLIVENSTSGAQQVYKFASPETDPEDIASGKINSVSFVSLEKISKMLGKAGAFDSENRNNGLSYLLNNSEGNHKLDFSYSAIPKEFPEASDYPLDAPSPMLFIPEGGDGYVHNHMNFGNFLWGASGHSLGIDILTLRLGAHFNSLAHPTTNGYTGQFDSEDDQRSINSGVNYAARNLLRLRSWTPTKGLSAPAQKTR